MVGLLKAQREGQSQSPVLAQAKMPPQLLREGRHCPASRWAREVPGLTRHLPVPDVLPGLALSSFHGKSSQVSPCRKVCGAPTLPVIRVNRPLPPELTPLLVTAADTRWDRLLDLWPPCPRHPSVPVSFFYQCVGMDASLNYVFRICLLILT